MFHEGQRRTSMDANSEGQTSMGSTLVGGKSGKLPLAVEMVLLGRASTIPQLEAARCSSIKKVAIIFL